MGTPTIEDKIADQLGFIISSLAKGQTSQDLPRNYLLEGSTWYEVYNFIEIHLSCLPSNKMQERSSQYNKLLESEKSGYRIINGEVVPITNENEIQAIESACCTPLDPVNQHIQKALSLYADLDAPDYENSVKESISAVEAMCCTISGLSGPNATLGRAIKKLKENGVQIHSAMESAFSSLYGYASDQCGIRHGGIDFKEVPPEDAKYMLVSCSAFINYLIEKWSNTELYDGTNNILSDSSVK